MDLSSAGHYKTKNLTRKLSTGRGSRKSSGRSSAVSASTETRPRGKSTAVIEAWLQSHELQGKKLEKILSICSAEIIETPADLRLLHEKGELKDVFTQSGLRVSLEKVLQADAGEQASKGLAHATGGASCCNASPFRV
jgi:hypothetical protein